MPKSLTHGINYDVYGHCIQCHRNMRVEKYIDGKIQTILLGEYSETTYLLDDGSRMRVAICCNCKKVLMDRDDEFKTIMKCVIKGWDVETDDLVSDNKKPHWTKDKKKEYMSEMSKKKILTRTEFLSESTVDKVYKGYIKKLEEKKTKKRSK